MQWLQRLDRLIGHIMAATQWLALPLILLLFLQWPLRDLVRQHSTQANDLGQIVFALYVAVSVTAATRAGTHLAADTLAQYYSLRTRRILWRAGTIIGLMPWAAFVLIASFHIVTEALSLRESFAETGNPGYFLIKLALWVMALPILAQAVVDVFRPVEEDDV